MVAPPSKWTNVTANLANMASECGTLTMISAKPGSNMVIAGIAKQGLWATTDGGTTWAKLGKDDAAQITNRPSSIVYDPDHPDVFWESGIYNGQGVYPNRRRRQDIQAARNATALHNDSGQRRFRRSGAQDASCRQSRDHAEALALHRCGATWKDIGMNIPADSNFSNQPLVLSPQSFLLGSCGYGRAHAESLRARTAAPHGPSRPHSARPVAPLVAKDKSIYWTMIYDSGIMKSGDQGATWKKAGSSQDRHSPSSCPMDGSSRCNRRAAGRLEGPGRDLEAHRHGAPVQA